MKSNKLGFLKNAFFVSFFSTLSTFFAFFVQLVLANRFGASYEMDAYFTAITVPTVIVRLLGLPLNFVFIPLVKEAEEKNNHAVAEKFYSWLFWMFFVFFSIAGLIIFFFSHQFSSLIIPGASTQTIELTSNLLKLSASYVLLVGMYFVTQTMHVAKESYFVPFFGNMLSSITMITATLLLLPTQGIYAAIYGLILGALVEVILNFIYLPEKVFVWPKIPRDLQIKFLKLFIPLGIGSLIYRSTPLIDRYFASFLGKGDISVLGYGLKFLESIVGFLAAGLSLSLLPSTSKFSALEDKKNISEILSWGLRATGLLLLPVVFYTIFFSDKLITVLFQRGNFTPDTTVKVGGVLATYAGALFALSVGGQLANIFYAKKKHLQVVLINIALLPLYILLVAVLSKKMDVYGISLSYSIFTALTVAVYLYFMRQYSHFDWRRILVSYLKYALASVAMILVIFLVEKFNLNLSGFLQLGFEVVVGGLIYFVTLYLVKSQEFLQSFEVISQKFLPKKK